MSTNITSEWKTVSVEPERLRSGLWGYEKGDIYASYSADVYALENTLHQAFNFAHRPHVAMGIHSNGLFEIEAKSYPIHHASYAGDVMADYQASGLHDHYTGKAVSYKRQDCIFGLPIIFRQRDLTKPEIIDQCRRAFAYGGLFAAEAGSYQNLLRSWQQKEHPRKIQHAFAEELADNSLPATQRAMREFIEASHAKAIEEQLCLF